MYRSLQINPMNNHIITNCLHFLVLIIIHPERFLKYCESFWQKQSYSLVQRQHICNRSRQGISHLEFYGDVIYKLRNIHGHIYFRTLFVKRIKSFIRKDYDPTILQRTSRLVIDPSTVNSHAFLWLCDDRQGLILHDGLSLNLSPEGYMCMSDFVPFLSVIP